MKRYIKITREGMGSYIQPSSEIANAIDGEFADAIVGDTITLTLLEMTEEEFEALPEFQGW